MISWRVERGRTCMYSQLKACSSSEVAAMIEGLLRHCTDAQIQANYTATHGASVVGFAFTELLGFKLLPRLKNIGSIRLNSPEAGPATWSKLERIIKNRPINWELIANHYDQMIKYATALRVGTAEAEQVLRRFTKGGPKQPVYLAMENSAAPYAPSEWAERLTPEDRRGLSPLFWTHINPYGRFYLDMNTRLDLTAA